MKDGVALRLFDSTRPSDSLKTLLAVGNALNLEVSWSPDSRWIACGFQDMSGSSILWAISVPGGNPIGFENGEAARRFLWASDGFLYVWKSGSRATRYAPPENSRDSVSVSTVATTRLLNLDMYPIRFNPMSHPQVVPLPELGTLPSIRATFPDGRRFLVGQKVVDANARVLARLDGRAREDSSNTPLSDFTPCSVTADARFVAGHYDVTRAGPGDDEVRILKSPVFLTDTLGRARIPLEGAPYSRRIECVPRGAWAALESQAGLVVGKIRTTP